MESKMASMMDCSSAEKTGFVRDVLKAYSMADSTVVMMAHSTVEQLAENLDKLLATWSVETTAQRKAAAMADWKVY